MNEGPLKTLVNDKIELESLQKVKETLEKENGDDDVKF